MVLSPEAWMETDKLVRFPSVFHLIESNEQSLIVGNHIERDCHESVEKNNWEIYKCKHLSVARKLNGRAVNSNPDILGSNFLKF